MRTSCIVSPERKRKSWAKKSPSLEAGSAGAALVQPKKQIAAIAARHMLILFVPHYADERSRGAATLVRLRAGGEGACLEHIRNKTGHITDKVLQYRYGFHRTLRHAPCDHNPIFR